MVAARQDRTLPLPEGWPRRVRSFVVHAISLAQLTLTTARGWAANSSNARVRRMEQNDRLRQEIRLLLEELRNKDERMTRIPPQRWPHYQPTERLAILELRAARGWSLAQTARTFLVTPLTIASWTARLDKEGENALVRLPVPVNRFPDFVGYLVKRLKVLCPRMGKVMIAQILARAGLHLSPTTVRRMMRDTRRPRPLATVTPTFRTITARKPNDLWHIDLTTVPTALGFWIPWLPFALPQTWPFCWWVAVAVDHCSRRVMGFAVIHRQPTSAAVRRFLERLFQEASRRPIYLVSDQGPQFIAGEFKRWCRRRGIRQRFGAIGKYGSLAVIERSIRTLRNECTRRRAIVPYRFASFENELELYLSWYNGHRPHSRLRGAKPDEVYHRRRPAHRAPRFEPRAAWPRRSPCASPQTLVRGQPSARLNLGAHYHGGRRHLPIVTLRRAA